MVVEVSGGVARVDRRHASGGERPGRLDREHVQPPDGHGPLWDLAEDPVSIALIETTPRSAKPVALVCHAPGVLHRVTDQDGSPLVQGRQVTGFADTAEEAVGLTDIVPALVEDTLKQP